MCRMPDLFLDCVVLDVAAASRVYRHTVDHYQTNIEGARGIRTSTQAVHSKQNLAIGFK